MIRQKQRIPVSWTSSHVRKKAIFMEVGHTGRFYCIITTNLDVKVKEKSVQG